MSENDENKFLIFVGLVSFLFGLVFVIALFTLGFWLGLVLTSFGGIILIKAKRK
jgi:hypothetical protein